VTGTSLNELRLTGQLLEISTLRYTPAGLPAVNFTFSHHSRQIEADTPREVEVEIKVVALGQAALLLQGSKPGAWLKLCGFIAAQSQRSKQPVLHVNTIEFMEGMENGI